jgi:hypothetical protein
VQGLQAEKHKRFERSMPAAHLGDSRAGLSLKQFFPQNRESLRQRGLVMCHINGLQGLSNSLFRAEQGIFCAEQGIGQVILSSHARSSGLSRRRSAGRRCHAATPFIKS